MLADGLHSEGEDGGGDQPLMKPLPDLGSSELRELGAAISQDIYTSSQGVAWGDVAGLEGAKHLLREALVMPMQFPDIFTGILTPWKVCFSKGHSIAPSLKETWKLQSCCPSLCFEACSPPCSSRQTAAYGYAHSS